MAPRKPAAAAAPTEIFPLKQHRVSLRVVGRTGLFFNAMSAKAQRTLLLGGGKKTVAEKKGVKHDPIEEFRTSVYKQVDGPTLLGFPAPAFKAAMATAALETPGMRKASINRLLFLPQERVPIWGIPRLRCDVVRSADVAKTPDIRTRAFLTEWAAEVEIAFVDTLLHSDIHALLANAGVIIGIGDFRQEKGKGSFGTFAPVLPGDGLLNEEWERITSTAGREAQIAAMENPEPVNEVTAELLDMFFDEVERRKPA